jgi:ABC-type sugar transport system ATPase subunit
MIAGREMKEPGLRKSNSTGETLLKVNNLCGKGFRNISFDLSGGEILGFYGLVGSGRSELGRTLYGADRINKGTILLEGRPFSPDSPSEALAEGIAMVPEDRKEQALFMNLPVISNMTISRLRELSHLNFYIGSESEEKITDEYIRLLNIKSGDRGESINSLSGGNQQKVVLARNLMVNPRILILDEPTQGIDVSSKEEIYSLIGKLAAGGMAIILISSVIPEVLSISDRIAVMHEGELAGILGRDQATERKLIAYATGYTLQVSD